MNKQTIYLDSDDDIVSIIDRLSWAQSECVVFVLPDRGDVLTERLDLLRLRRRADQLNVEVGLVSGDSVVTREARKLGFATFAAAKMADRSGRRAWRQARRARFQSYRQTARVLMDEYDRQEVHRRLRVRPQWQRWALRYAGVALFFLSLTAAVIAIAYGIPSATVTLRPLTEPVRATRQIVADPLLESVNFSGASVPARLLVVTTEWQTTVETTGSIEIPDAPARGSVVFANRRDEAQLVPAGTRITSSAAQRIIFQTLRDVEVPGVIGGTAEVDIVAIVPGPGGNVDAGSINRVEGSLSLQLTVRNLEPTEGGGVRIARAVTADDRDRLRAQVLQFIQALALGEMEASLTSQEFLAQDSLRVVNINQETYSHFVGEQTDRLVLEIRAEVHGTAVDETQATDLIYQELAAQVQPGFELVPASLRFYAGDVSGVDAQGRVSFIMVGEGTTAARLDTSAALEAVSGQDPAVAMAYLNEQLPLRDYPTVEVWPLWFTRMPYLPVRINTTINASG